MGAIFRSEDMTLCQLYLQSEAAYSVVSQLGELAVVQFRDLNQESSAFTKKFVNEIRRTDDMERQLRYFERELKKEKMSLAELDEQPRAPPPREMIDLEAMFEKHEGELKELINNIDALKRNYCELYELKFVLRTTEDFMIESDLSGLIGETTGGATSGDLEMTSMETAQQPSRMYLSYVAGVISLERLNGFMRLLWFACHGNVYVHHATISEPLEDAYTGAQVQKAVIMVFFQGEALKTKIQKICDGYKTTLYPCLDSPDERREMALGVLARLQDLETVLNRSQEEKERLLRSLAKHFSSWFIKVIKIKAIYHTLNMFNSDGHNYVAECFLPADQLQIVQELINKTTMDIGVSAPSLLHPIPCSNLPTYFRTNKFTGAFQAIINAYGAPRYKEMNPMPFTVITFPFLFGVMFGDFGHGLLMFIFALWMVIKERSLEKTAKNSEMFGMIFAGRYIVLLMGVFSLYSGLLYNDCFSKSFNIFGSKWNVVYDEEFLLNNGEAQLDASNKTVYNGNPYPYGMDPIWQVSRNKITFLNSYKEKLSVILGVAHMVFGISLSFFNHWHLQERMKVWAHFIPEMLFLLFMFGYMDALIFVKWIKYDASESGCAPNILIGYINMFLFSYPGEDAICSSRTWYPGQQSFQTFLVIFCLLCAVWLLAARPVYLYVQHRKRSGTNLLHGDQFLDIEHAPGESSDDVTMINGVIDPNVSTQTGERSDLQESSEPPPPFNTGEIMIHQAIHTIEFCLGCISHTASYLRLWALSLAHSQLSEVLWNMVLRIGLKVGGYPGFVVLYLVFPGFAGGTVAILLVMEGLSAFLHTMRLHCHAFGIYLLFPGFAGGTVAILLVMEGLSAFLHTMRLHWVEFQHKFYLGDGFLFEPFNLKEIAESGQSEP